MLAISFTRRLSALLFPLTLALGVTGLRAAYSDVSPESAAQPPKTRSSTSFLDRIPEYVTNRLPVFDSDDSLHLTVKPRLGEFFRKGYIRVPIGLRWNATPKLEFETEVLSYFPHGNGDTTEAGLAGANFGVKYKHILPNLVAGDIGIGLDYRMPFSHSPMVLTDGYRHLQPFIAYARPLVPKWNLLGFTSLGANFFEHTNHPSNLGRNQLHANSLALAWGVARDWQRFHATLTARLASTALTSDEGRQNFQLRPEVAFPLRRNLNAPTQIYITLGGRVMFGPDGRQTNTNGGFRVNYRFDRGRYAHPDATAMRF